MNAVQKAFYSGEDYENCYIFAPSISKRKTVDSVASIGISAFEGCNKLTSAIFKNPNGWWYSSSSTAISGTNISSDSLSNPSTAATYLMSTYYDYYWKRS